MNKRDASGAASLLRAVLNELPPSTARETAYARRIEGAVIALDSVALPQPAASDQLR